MNKNIIDSFDEKSIPRIGETKMYRDYLFVNLPKDLINYIDCLIEWVGDGKKLSITDLSWGDKKHFIAHIIKFKISEGEGWDWLMDSNNREQILSKFCDYLLAFGDEEREEYLEDFVQELINSATTELNELMQHLINVRIEYIKGAKTQELISSGAIKIQYQDNGEIGYFRYGRKVA